MALKQLTTLDLLSGGRVVTAVAAGWMEGEFKTLGAPFEQRGRLLDEWLDLAAAAFEQLPGRVRWQGELLSLDGWLAPALVRRPELWVAGVSRATVRRARKTGVWHPVALAPERLRKLGEGFEGRTILRISAYFSDEPKTGEDERGRHAVEGPPEWIAERLRDYVAAGCDGFVLNLGHDAPDLEQRARRFAAEVAPLL